MTTSAEIRWTADAWRARLASKNPVFPYEWAVRYQGGGLFRRVCDGRVRTSRDVPLVGIAALVITGPRIRVVEIDAPPGELLGVELAATVIGQLGVPAEGTLGIAAWRFGFRDAAGFWGIVLDPAGRLTRIRPPSAGTGRGHV